MNTPFKDSVRKEFQKPELSEQQLNKLMAMQQQSDPEQQSPEIHGRTKDISSWLRYAALASVLAFTLLAGFIAGDRYSSTDLPLTERIAQEVVYNHLKGKPLDIKTAAFAEASGYFSELGFRPFISSLFDGQLIGGRYCSLQTEPSAQLRYTDEQGNLRTLYQTAYRDDLFAGLPSVEKGEAPVVAYANGIAVTIWVERGIVFAVTQ